MIIRGGDLPDGAALTASVAVIGAGPGGIVAALELAADGRDVVLLESGELDRESAAQRLSDAATYDEDVHAPLGLAVRRQVGGTSKIWGGRCVPYDPVDFASRDITHDAAWPVAYDEIAPFFARACAWLKCGRPAFSSHDIPALPRSLADGLHDSELLSSALERWSLPTDFGREYTRKLTDAPNIRLVTSTTCVSIDVEESAPRASSLRCVTAAGAEVRVHADTFVVAAGGLESTRLLLNSSTPSGQALGDHSGHLGRYYMAHLEGSIADVEFYGDPAKTVYDYERDVDGTYVRRRFVLDMDTQLRESLPNVAAWISNPQLADAAHNSGELSFVFLALTSPLGPMFAPDAQRLALSGRRVPGTPYGESLISARREHVGNVLRHPIRTAHFAADFGGRRFVSRGRKAPGFFMPRADNVYPLQYHGEHLPAAESSVSLSDARDATGMRKLDIDLRFAPADFDGIVRTHEVMDAELQRQRAGRLRYRYDDLHDAVRRKSGGGFHQVGTTRMANRPEGGVVAPDLSVYGASNVYVVSSSVFPTSGQANSTFMIVAFALRLADQLR